MAPKNEFGVEANNGEGFGGFSESNFDSMFKEASESSQVDEVGIFSSSFEDFDDYSSSESNASNADEEDGFPPFELDSLNKEEDDTSISTPAEEEVQPDVEFSFDEQFSSNEPPRPRSIEKTHAEISEEPVSYTEGLFDSENDIQSLLDAAAAGKENSSDFTSRTEETKNTPIPTAEPDQSNQLKRPRVRPTDEELTPQFTEPEVEEIQSDFNASNMDTTIEESPTVKEVDSQTMDISFVRRVISTIDAIRSLSDDSVKMANIYITNGQPVNSNDELVLAAIEADKQLMKTSTALIEAKKQAAVDRAFSILALDDATFTELGDLVLASGESGLPSDFKFTGDRLTYARALVDGIDRMTDDSVKYIEATQSILLASE